MKWLEIIAETLLTRLINGSSRQYVATFKTTKNIVVNCLILVYTWFYVQLIVIDPFRGTRWEYYLA